MDVRVRLDADAIDGMGAEIYRAAANAPGLEPMMMRIASAKAASINASMSAMTEGRVTGPFFPHFKRGVPGSIVAASVAMPRSDFRGKGGMVSLAIKTGSMHW